ncbi:MAG: flavin reductase [Candidatus Scatovivens sp.]
MEIDNQVFRDINYGMYVISTKDELRNVGCFVNTVVQITSENPIISVSINKNNYTNSVIKKSKKFSIAILSENTNPEVIGKFGFFSSKELNKFENFKFEEIENLPVLMENICGYLICEVINIINAETHDVFLARVVSSKKVNTLEPMSYSYYHKVIKGKAPKNAPTYIEENKENTNGNMRYKCKICGHIYDDSKEKIKFSELPDDWKCPICGVGKEMFEKID